MTGVNFVDYVARTRFEKACDLLRFDLRISEIAFAVGFQSLSQFNRVFKKLSGNRRRNIALRLQSERNLAELRIAKLEQKIFSVKMRSHVRAVVRQDCAYRVAFEANSMDPR